MENNVKIDWSAFTSDDQIQEKLREIRMKASQENRYLTADEIEHAIDKAIFESGFVGRVSLSIHKDGEHIQSMGMANSPLSGKTIHF